jgi:ADP-ribose pyrophosphatase YjhB (NUDIX family)
MANSNLKGPIHKLIPESDDRLRKVCLDCGYIAYDNPKIIAGAVCTWENKFLMCKRAIEPRKGYWTIPAGYLEVNETTAEGAKREVWEEACASTNIIGLIGIYEIPRISQIYIIYKAEMTNSNHRPGPESEKVMLCKYEEIPWDDLAFSSVRWGLEHFQSKNGPIFEIHPH